jgi:hypothetical protein
MAEDAERGSYQYVETAAIGHPVLVQAFNLSQ